MPPIAVVLIFMIVGTALLISSRAETIAVAVEPEAGSSAAGAVVVQDTSASGGKSVRFAQSPGAGSLVWPAPALTTNNGKNPYIVTITNSSTVAKDKITGATVSVNISGLQTDRDYELRLPGHPENPQSTPLQRKNGLFIIGGRNVVISGGHITHAVDYVKACGGIGGDRLVSGGYGCGWYSDVHRALRIGDWTGTFHIEGLLIDGPMLFEGVNVTGTKPNAVFQMQRSHIGRVKFLNLTGSPWYKTNGHDGGDPFQVWTGPRGPVRFDRVTMTSDYQGFFLAPDDVKPDGITHLPTIVDIRRVNLHLYGYEGFYQGKMTSPSPSRFDVNLQDVFFDLQNGKTIQKSVRATGFTPVAGSDSVGSYVTFPEATQIKGKIYGRNPPAGDYMPASGAGFNYIR